MTGFNLVDGAVAIVIVLSAILAYSRGFVREAMAILGWVGAAIFAFLLAPTLQPLVKEIPVLNKFLADSCELSIIAAFAAAFAVGLVIASLFTPLFASVVQRSVLGGLDQGLGFLFGVARGVLLVPGAACQAALRSRGIVEHALSPRCSRAQRRRSRQVTMPTHAPTWSRTGRHEMPLLSMSRAASPATIPAVAVTTSRVMIWWARM